MRIRHSNFDSDPVRVTIFYCYSREKPWQGVLADIAKIDIVDDPYVSYISSIYPRFGAVSIEIVCYFILGPTQLKRVVKSLNRGLIDPSKLTYPHCGGKHGGESRIDIFSYAKFNGVI